MSNSKVHWDPDRPPILFLESDQKYCNTIPQHGQTIPANTGQYKSARYGQNHPALARDNADVIMNITGNVISGQVMGETAKQLSERIGKIMQNKESFSINSSDISISRSRQLESAAPPSKIAALSSGEFVGMVADDPEMKIELKAFHAEIINDHEKLQKEKQSNKVLPILRDIDQGSIEKNYLQIKREVNDIINAEIDRILHDPLLKKLVLKKSNK
jgi:hypothetical protein